jgi:antibiotic biosynthesis monooxygenase (ABM) superfamily enzyme
MSGPDDSVPHHAGTATWLITRRPRPDRVREFEQVLADTIHAALRFPGHLGVTVLKPSPPEAGEYQLVVKFDSEASLRGWQQSDEAAGWFAKIAALEERPGTFAHATGLEAWFAVPAGPANPRTLTRGTMFLVTWLAAFPTIALLTWTLGPVVNQWPLLVRTAIVSGLMVALLTWVVMPPLVRWLSPWVFKGRA